jgi:drug/metabolite transporter (DMT)-like permease
MKKTSTGPDLAALLVVLIWGVNFPFLKLALDRFGLAQFTFLRFSAMIGLGWLVLLATRRSPLIRRSDLPRIGLAAILGYTLYITGSLVGIYFTTAFSNALLISTAPIFALLLLRLLRVETVGRWQLAGMLCSAAGVVIFISSVPGGNLLGDAINLGAAFCYAAYNVINKPLVQRYPATVVTAWTLTIGAIPILLVTGPSLGNQDWARVGWEGWAILAWSVVFPVYFAWTVWSWVQSRVGVARPVAFMYLVPLVAGAVSFLLAGEGFGWLKIAGAGVVLGGLARSRRQPAPAPSQPQPKAVAEAA